MIDSYRDTGSPTVAHGVTSVLPEEDEAKNRESGLVHIIEGYYKYTDILFDWPKYMNIWHRNAVKALLNGECMTHPGHPFAAPNGGGVELYLSTAEDGQQKLLFSLKQIEYLQYYIHETGLALPRKVYDITGGVEAGWPKDFDFDAVKIEEWIPLPLNVLLPQDIGEVKPITLASLPAIKKEVTRISKHNKAVKKNAIMMRPSTDAERNLAEAWADNEREGPGLRSGPRRKSYNRSGWGNEEEDHQAPGSTHANAGPEETYVPLTPEFSDSQSDGLSLSMPPSILEKVEPDTPAEHYYYAEQALLLASGGGLVGALHQLGETAPEGDPNEDEKKIGRSLFLALDIVTSEADESVVLEIGWAAIWWQSVKADDPKGDFEPIRDQGHFIVQDHILTARNGKVKPDHREDYLFGSSLPVQAKDVDQTMNQLVADLSTRSGKGPIYIVLHNAREAQSATEVTVERSSQYLDLLKIGLFPAEWHETLRPTATELPIYGTFDGVGSISIINTSLLYAAIDSQGEPKEELEASNAMSKSLEEVAIWLFSQDASRLPKSMGNAGNKANCLIDVLMSLICDHKLPEHTQSAVTNDQPKPANHGAVDDDQIPQFSPDILKPQPLDEIPAGFVEVKERDPNDSYDSYDSDDSAMGSGDWVVKGVVGKDGESVGFEESDEDSDD